MAGNLLIGFRLASNSAERLLLLASVPKLEKEEEEVEKDL